VYLLILYSPSREPFPIQQVLPNVWIWSLDLELEFGLGVGVWIWSLDLELEFGFGV
jgi:hypothetical protein